jgi:biotin carboxylase
MTANILILGAGKLQIPLIKKAKEMGLTTWVVDRDPNAIGKQIAGHFYPIDTIDKEMVLKMATEINADSILTVATDVPVPTISYVAEKLGLVANSSGTAFVCRNKFAMRNRMAENNIPIPRYILVDSYRQAKKGITKVNDYEELEQAFKHALVYSTQNSILIEEYIGGKEISVESISFNSEHHILAITDKVTTGEPYFVERIHSQYSLLPDNIQKNIKILTKKCISALGIETGASHTEIKIDNGNNLKVIEVGARMGGDLIGTHLVPLSTGIDYVKACIEVSLGITPDLTPKFKKGAAVQFIMAKPGKIISIKNPNIQHDGIVDIDIYSQQGDFIKTIDQSGNRIGHILATAETPQEALKSANSVNNDIEVVIERRE